MDSPPPQFLTIAPVLPVSDLNQALTHYGQLGFETSESELGGYGFAKRNDVWLHLVAVPGLDPDEEGVSCYIYVADADAVHAEWRAGNALGVLMPPNDTEYGLREFAHIDPDGNLLRIGSWITSDEGQ